MSVEKQLVWHALRHVIMVAKRFWYTTKMHHLLLEYGCYGNEEQEQVVLLPWQFGVFHQFPQVVHGSVANREL